MRNTWVYHPLLVEQRGKIFHKLNIGCETSYKLGRKKLSQESKEVFIKVVALLILTYAMSCFKLLDSLCSDLEGMIACF